MQEAGTAGRRIMAAFENNKPYAFSIGGDEWRLQAYRFRRDAIPTGPARLYKHWGNERMAAWFAIGVEVPEGLGTNNRKTVNYPNCGHPG